MFYVIDKMARYFGVSIWKGRTKSKVFKSLILKELFDLQLLSVLPLGIAVLLVYFHSFFMVSWYLESVFVDWSSTVCFEPSLVDHSRELLLSFHVALTIFPTRSIKKIVKLGIQGHCDRIILEGGAKIIPCRGAVSPLDKHLITSSCILVFPVIQYAVDVEVIVFV